jgi:hypothetical protein
MPTTVGDAERALYAAHEAIAVVKMYLSEQQDRSWSASPDDARSRDLIIDGFMQYVRSVVTAAAQGTLAKAPPPVSGDLVSMLCSELEAVRRDREFTADAVERFNATMLRLRSDDDVTQVYKHRIVELQAVINGTKRPQDIQPDVGVRAPVVPTGLSVTEDQKRAEACNSLSRLTSQMKDKMERLKAENIKLSGDKAILVTEAKLLADRVKVLEAQLGVMASSASVNLRELHKQRTLVSRLAAQKDDARLHQRQQQHQLQPGECLVGGIVMDRDVALWLHDVYHALLADPTAAETLRNLKRSDRECSAAPSTISRGSAEESSGSQRAKRTPSASTRETNSLPASRPGSRPASGSIPTYGQTKGLTMSFTEFIADPDPEIPES